MSVTYADMSKADRQKVRREMMKHLKAALKGSAMSPRQVDFAVRKMADQAIARETENGKTQRSSAQ